MDGVEEADGLLNTVLSLAGGDAPVQVRREGPYLVVTLEDSRQVLTTPNDFAVPFDVARGRVRRVRTDAGPANKPTQVLDPAAVQAGTVALTDELDRLKIGDEAHELDVLKLLGMPIAVSTTAAMVPSLDPEARVRVARLALRWIDALGPVISAPRPPRSWTRIRRAERHAHRHLIDALVAAGASAPEALATALAAGIQVPVAAGAWCLTQFAGHPNLQQSVREDRTLALPYVWEILRLYPPTWALPRVTTRRIVLRGTEIPAFSPVLVSPVALGRLSDLVPGPEIGFLPRDQLDPRRWVDSKHRPGAWLPFGAGPHACPGRNLGLNQLTRLVLWAGDLELVSDGPPRTDETRGLMPRPSRISLRTR